MAAYYTSQTISGYNSTPPADDGSAVSANEITWAKHKTKLADPVKTLAEAINTQLGTAFGKMFLNGISAVATTSSIGVGDLGKLISATSTITLSLPAVATATEGFTVVIRNSGAGTVTLDGDSAETINGAATIALAAGDFAVLTTSGTTGWEGPVYVAAVSADTLAGLANTDGNFAVGNGSAWVVESGATARTSLGLAALAIQDTVAAGDIDSGAAEGSMTTIAAGTTYTHWFKPEEVDTVVGGGYIRAAVAAFIVQRSGTYTFDFDLKLSTGATAYARVYQDGVAIGTERSTASTTFVSVTTESLALTAGSYVEIYVQTNTGGATSSVRNVKATSAQTLLG